MRLGNELDGEHSCAGGPCSGSADDLRDRRCRLCRNPAQFFGAVGFGRDTNTYAGFVLGGGIEGQIVENWTVRIEALCYDLGTATIPFAQLPPGEVNRIRIDDAFVIRAGVSVSLNQLFGE